MPDRLKLIGGPGGPNPFKVMTLLEELKVPYDFEVRPYETLKIEPYTSINPNGRVPALIDSNTDVTVWESGAIFEYLLETYDTEGVLSHNSSPERWQEKQWFFLSLTTQGPYWGQASWFNMLHEEELPSAQERYMREIHRLVKVLDGHLSKQVPLLDGYPVLVGKKVTYADLIFVQWHEQLPFIFTKFPTKWNVDEYPSYKRWIDGLKQRPSVQVALGSQKDVILKAQAGEYK